jgi:hypothetical protein
MSITVRELLQLPHLRLTLTAGAAGLDRQVSWVHSSDLPNPWQWLEPAELLLTNQEGLTPGDVAQVRFLERLAETGASGLGVGVGMGGPPVSVQITRRADELAFPLISVPYSVPFTAVARAVADANGREEARLLRLGAELLSQLLDRGIDPRLAQSLITEAGLDLAAAVLAVARAETDQDCAELHRKLARSHLPHLLLDRDHLLYVVLPEAALDGHLASALAESARIGSSARLAAPSRLPEAVQEARWALGAAEAENRALVRYGDQTALLLPRSVTEAQAVVSRILGPLVTNDAEHGTTYVDTLRVILRHDRSWQLAAAELHIHKQTLGYRIRKIEQLTGRGLTSTEHLAEWWFALRAHDLLTGRTPG